VYRLHFSLTLHEGIGLPPRYKGRERFDGGVFHLGAAVGLGGCCPAVAR
jgi:hypothetical protein